MALTNYQTLTFLQLQNPGSAAQKIYTTADITSYINLARSQIAGEAMCIRNLATLGLTQGTRVYNFSSITLGTPSTGIAGIFNVRQALLGLGAGNIWLHPRSFEWFTLYSLGTIVPAESTPIRWSQYGQGATGSLYVDPIPDADYTATLDCVCYPVPLVDDLTPEAIPFPWTDVVPFYAAWYALCAVQRFTDAEKMMERVHMYMARARSMSNPDVVPQVYSQAPQDPSVIGHLGLQPKGQ